MARKVSFEGELFNNATRLAYVPKKHNGKIIGRTLRVFPIPVVRIRMSAREAFVIASSMEPGYLHRRHRLHDPDLTALHAVGIVHRMVL